MLNTKSLCQFISSLFFVFSLCLTFTTMNAAHAQDPALETGAATVDDENDLEEALSDPGRVVVGQDGAVSLTGYVDKILPDTMFVINDGQRIRVNLEKIDQSDQLRDLFREGDVVTVQGTLADTASIGAGINAIRIGEPKDNNAAANPDIEFD